MWVGNRRNPAVAALLIASWISIAPAARAQLNAGATVALSARLPSSVTLSDTQLPVAIVVSNGTQALSNSTVRIKWNLDARTAAGFRIVGTLIGSALPATALEGRTASAGFRPLRQNGSIVLMEKLVTAAKCQGEIQTEIQLQVNETAIRNLPDGVYQGWLKLEAQIL